MRFRSRSAEPAIAELATSGRPADVELLLELVAVVVAERVEAERRAEAAESFAAGIAVELVQARQAESEGVDAGQVLDELCHLAGTELPNAVATAIDLMDQKAELSARADRAEAKSELLYSALTADLAALPTTDDEVP